MNEDPFSSSAESRLSGFFDWTRSNAISISLVLALLVGSFFIYLYFQNKKEEKISQAIEANQSINESLSRTIVTSVTTFLVVLILFLVGGEVIHSFAFAMIVGVIVGTYSSIFVASPVVIKMAKEN